MIERSVLREGRPRRVPLTGTVVGRNLLRERGAGIKGIKEA